jgi:hypothetical protein
VTKPAPGWPGCVLQIAALGLEIETESGSAIPLEHGLSALAEVEVERVSPVQLVLRIVLDVVEQALRHLSGCDPIKARFGAISYLHRFGSSLNPHVHFHCCVTDGLFSVEADGVKFHI